MNNWKSDKKTSDVYLPEIKQILGEYLIGEPPAEEDQERNTDLIVLTMLPVRIACRVRTYQYLQRGNYKEEFTVRSGRPSGVKTELRKIIEGWGDYLFYGFGCEAGKNLAMWHLLDLKVFRWSFAIAAARRTIPADIPNNDLSSTFKAFRISDFPASFVVARMPT